MNKMADERAVILRLEQLSREYNILSQLLTTQQRSGVSQQGASSDNALPSNKDAKISSLEKEVQELTNKIEAQISEKCAVEKALQQKENENTKLIGKLKQEIKDCNNDTEVLKDVIKRLNEQLNRYHLKYGRIREENIGSIKKDLKHDSIYKLGALLTAYDEIILERDEALKSNLEKFEKLMVNVDAVTAENEKLHQRVKKLQQEAPMGSEEAEMVAADAKLLLEERELLLQEVRTLHQQQQEESISYQQRVAKLQQHLEDSETRVGTLSSELDSLRTEAGQLERQCKKLQQQLQESVSKEEHQIAVDECQRLFEKLRKTYTEESGDLKGKMRAVKQEKQTLAEKLTDSSAHVHNLSVQVSGLKGSLRKTESRVKRREKALQVVQTTARVAQTRLKSLSEVCSKLLEDREKLLEALAAQRKETEELSKELTLRSAAVGALSQKLKEERINWSSKMAECEGGRQAAKAAWKRSTKENSHLRTLIGAKDDTITSLIADYKILGLEVSDAKHRSLHQKLSKSGNLPGNLPFS
ncbi:putative leucine-rich repeat-containing protein DDB_G0290503 [Penaeus indicus]|uniref:putative leucine-rich repeat-containing protein DDB_G0290503 n=1 Tax=Penaeus indicus TaxID=29960 RepID=UPI00300D9B10